MFITILYIIQILICGVLIALITSSDKDDAGIGGAIGGGGAGGGNKGKFKPGYEEQMDNITKYFAIGFFVFSILIAHFLN